jgi:hypothetical protein
MKNINKNNILTCFYLSSGTYINPNGYFSAITYSIKNDYITELKRYSHNEQIELAEILKVKIIGDDKSNAIVASITRNYKGYILVFDINSKKFIFFKEIIQELGSSLSESFNVEYFERTKEILLYYEYKNSSFVIFGMNLNYDIIFTKTQYDIFGEDKNNTIFRAICYLEGRKQYILFSDINYFKYFPIILTNESRESEIYLTEKINKDSTLENPSTIINEFTPYESYLSEENNKDSPLEKCQIINEESLKLNLCIKCNNKKGYFTLNDPLIRNKSDFIECVNEETKPSNFYFNFVDQAYDKCYESCSSCIYGGNEKDNNCSICAINYIFDPYKIGSKNCVKKCPYFYYLSSNNEYKCTNNSQCIGENILFIKEKLECINNCEKDDIYLSI